MVSPRHPASLEFESPVQLASFPPLASERGKTAAPSADPNLYRIVSLLNSLTIFTSVWSWVAEYTGKRWINMLRYNTTSCHQRFFINKISNDVQLSISWSCYHF